MNILKIIHGYPPLYNAGSEVYSQMLCHALTKNNQVHVMTREENPFAANYSWRETRDTINNNISISVINIPVEKFRYRFEHTESDENFLKIIDKVQPDIVHIGHLNHLSLTWVDILFQKKIPMVYTLHDYWLMCPRGQFIQRNSPTELWALCDGQNDNKCAQNCYAGYFTGCLSQLNQDEKYWAQWVSRRMSHMKEMTKKISLFIAPARYLLDRFVTEFAMPPEKVIYLDYGFDLTRLKHRKRTSGEPFTFGYIGTHIPAKGIQLLLRAFGKLQGECKLRIWGRSRDQYTAGLQAIVATLPEDIQTRVEWRTEYSNENIVEDVFNHTDCIVVPSIWVENSPLVIHEALQVRVPVITANAGGMAEYVQHEKNGLLFQHRDHHSLADQMQRLIDDSQLVAQLSKRGYLQSSDGNIPDMQEHAFELERIYRTLIVERRRAHAQD